MSESTAVLVGVTGGLGVALARLLASEGYRLVLSARREADPGEITGKRDGSAVFVASDVTDRASLERLAEASRAHLGTIGAVVNLAGISPRKSIENYSVADVDALLAINVKGPIFVTQAFLPMLRAQADGGVIVHVGGAVDGRMALPYQSAYAATRGALASYVQAANRELHGTNVVVSFFGPAPSNTESERPYFPIWRGMGMPLDEPANVAKALLTTMRDREKLHLRGGWPLKVFSKVNAVAPGIADAMGLRRYKSLFLKHRGEMG